MSTFPTNYRLEVLKIITNFLGRPFVLAALTWVLVLEKFPKYCFAILYLLAIPLYWTVHVQFDRLKQRREAASRGAILAPEINGKWLGNIDLIPKARDAFKNDYTVSWVETWFNMAPGEDTVNVRILWQDLFFTRNHKVIQTVLATGWNDWHKGPIAKLRFFGMFGNGIFNTDGAEWKAHRALTRPFFARERVTDYEHFDKYSDRVLDILRQRSDAGESVDIQDLFARFTLDAAGEFLFGTSEFNTLAEPLPLPGKAELGPFGSAVDGYFGSFVKAFEGIQLVTGRRVPYGKLWPLFEMITDASIEPNKGIDEWVTPLIQKALDAKKIRGSEKMAAEEGSLVDHLADTLDNDQAIRDETINILFASRDTTSGLLSFLFYALSKHPEVLRKLREEIMNAIPSGVPTYEDVRGLKYLRACLNETLRLWPNVPVAGRASANPTSIPGSITPSNPDAKPIYVPGPNVQLQYSILLMQRRENLWGKDALEYKPERWLDAKDLKQISSDPFKFIPFSAGPRICLGQNFAYNEASFLAVRILQAFDGLELRQKQDAPAGSLPPASWASGGGRRPVEEIFPRSALTIYSTGGVWIKMRAAKSEAN